MLLVSGSLKDAIKWLGLDHTIFGDFVALLTNVHTEIEHTANTWVINRNRMISQEFSDFFESHLREFFEGLVRTEHYLE